MLVVVIRNSSLRNYYVLRLDTDRLSARCGDRIRYFALNLDILPFACLSGSDGGSLRYTILVVMVPIVFGWILLAGWLSRLAFGEKNKLHISKSAAFNVFGTAYQSFFVLIVSWVIAPFRSFGHPSKALEGVRHLVTYPDVEVASADHGVMVGLALFAFVFYALSFLVFYVHQIRTLPTRAQASEQERENIKRELRFIFLRFRPERWYFLSFYYGLSSLRVASFGAAPVFSAFVLRVRFSRCRCRLLTDCVMRAAVLIAFC